MLLVLPVADLSARVISIRLSFHCHADVAYLVQTRICRISIGFSGLRKPESRAERGSTRGVASPGPSGGLGGRSFLRQLVAKTN